MSRMPKLPVETLCAGLNDSEARLIRAAFSTRGDRALRTAKPYSKVGRDKTEANEFAGRANYVWRMLAFDYAGFTPYVCMPVCADFDIPGDYTYRRAVSKELDAVIKRAEANLPVTLQGGVMRWGRALGIV